MVPNTAGITLAPTRQAPNAHAGADANPRLDSQASLLATIQRTWADVLQVEDVGPNADFFDLGGTSLLVVSAVELLGERVGIDVPVPALLAAPNPAAMVEQIAALRANAAGERSDGTTPFVPEWVIPLQSQGGGKPVFLFPGGRGSRLVLSKDAQIAAMVGRRHPFYGFLREQPHIAPGRADWIAAMATDYVAHIRTVQDRGPFLLYGICSGAALAWETAGLLIASGETVAGLCFYEAPLPADFDEPGSPQMPPRPFSENMPPYLPHPLNVDLTLLMSEGWQAKGKCDGWQRVARGPLRTVVMPGDTDTAKVHDLYSRREAMIAGHLRDWLARMEDRRAAS